jgi:twitching motility protein PilT
MVNSFPADKQGHVRAMLSTSLRGVICQQLLPRADGTGRVAALEILVNTPAVANLVRQGRLDQIESTLQAGAHAGMRTMDQSIGLLLEQQRITRHEAQLRATNKNRFEVNREQA